MKNPIRIVIVAALVAAGVLAGASAANAGDPSQWGVGAGSGKVVQQ